VVIEIVQAHSFFEDGCGERKFPHLEAGCGGYEGLCYVTQESGVFKQDCTCKKVNERSAGLTSVTVASLTPPSTERASVTTRSMCLCVCVFLCGPARVCVRA
jgi:hypothetical protein